MKRRELIKKLEGAGFRYVRHGGDHDVYVQGAKIETIPRHREIPERLAKTILKRNQIE